ncbi:hypothetical protein [Streptomyces sp. NPDC005795]|uniref:hypothetical protein n=1 Tax=Streptomyces sp. NPDC005795 TaxID=3154677 RepID=UPI0033E85C38
MLPTINRFIDARTASGGSVPLYVLRSVCFGWSRAHGGPFIEVDALEDVLRQRGATISRRPDGEYLVRGLSLLPIGAPDANAAAADTAAAMRKIATASKVSA